VYLPDDPAPVPEQVLQRLHPKERALALDRSGYGQVEFVGGRLAMAHALRMLGGPKVPITKTERGAPRLPNGWVGSVTHKRALAVAIASRDRGQTVGLDLEAHAPVRSGILKRVLTEDELAALDQSPDRAWLQGVLAFSFKESVYKALDPRVKRYVGFHEAHVAPDLYGSAEIALNLAQGEGPFELDARYQWIGGHVLTSVEIRGAEQESSAS